MDKYYIIIFQNTHEAMKAESETIKQKIKAMVIPTPTYITKSCGISLRINIDDIEKIKELISEEKINVKDIYFKDSTEVKLMTL